VELIKCKTSFLIGVYLSFILTLSATGYIITKEFVSIGIASFGPIDAKPNSPNFGYITSTPKPNWGWTDVLGGLGLRDVFKNIPYHFDTDVNAPAGSVTTWMVPVLRATPRMMV
jgi:hypothetical protein